MFHDAKSGSHLNGEKTDAVNIESDNVINLEDPSLDDSPNDFEPHGVTQSSPSSSIASLADNCPTVPAEHIENILVNQTWVDDVQEEDLEEASRECKRRKMSDQGRKALGRNLMNLPILLPPIEVVAPSSSGGPKAPQEALSFDLNQYDDDLHMFDDPRDVAAAGGRDDPRDVAAGGGRDYPRYAAAGGGREAATGGGREAATGGGRNDPRDDIHMFDDPRDAAAAGGSKKLVKEPKRSKKREDPMVAKEESASLVGSKNAQEFTITKCIVVLHKMEIIQRSERAAAYKVFKIAENRETFLTSAADDEESAAEWLRSEMAELPQRI